MPLSDFDLRCQGGVALAADGAHRGGGHFAHAQPGGHSQLDGRMAGADAQPDGVVGLALVQPLPVHRPLIVGIAVDAGLNLKAALEVQGRHPAADDQGVGVGQAGETLKMEVHRVARRAAPADIPAEQAPAQVEATLIAQHLAPVQSKAFAFHGHDQRQPVGAVDQFGVDDGHVVVHAVDERRRPGAGVALLESAPGAQITVAQGEQGLLAVQVSRVELGFDDGPTAFVHNFVVRIAYCVVRSA